MQKVQTTRGKHHAFKASDATNKNCSITNNTDADVVVINAYTDDDQSVEQLYERSLKILKTTGGQTAIKPGTTAAVILDTAMNAVIIARADNLFPVKAAAVDSNAEIISPLTVTTADAERTKLAAKFQKILTAFSSSSLAADFATALTNADPATMAAFFQSTDDYKTLTIDDVVAVQTYYATYPFVWAYYGSEKTYGLHATDGTTNSYVGYITLQNKCKVPLNADKTIPGFTITYTNRDVSRQLYFSAGQFVDDVNSASPAICLQGLFVLKSSITKSEDDQSLVAVLVGIIDGQSVLGYDEEQDLQNNGQLKDVSSSLDILVHPDDTKGWIELAGVILATILGLVVLAKVVKTIADKAFRDTPLTPQQIRDRIRDVTQRNLNRIKDLGLNDIVNLNIPTDVNASLEGIKKRGNDLLLKENKAKLQDIVNQQGKMLEQLANYSSNPELQDVGDILGRVNDTLLDTSSAYLGDSMAGMMSDLKDSGSTLSAEISSVRGQFSSEARRAVEDARNAVDTITKQVESNEDLRTDLAENRTPEERKLEELFETF